MDDFTRQPVTPSNPQNRTEVIALATPRRSLAATLKNFYHLNRYYIWISLLGIAIIGVLGYFALRPQPTTLNAARLVVAIEPPETIPASGDAIFKVKVDNADTSTLTNVAMELVYPSGVTYVTSTPQANNISGTSFGLPTLAPGQHTVVLLKVHIEGSIDEEKLMRARVRYRYANFSAEFNQDSEATFRLMASNVQLQFEGPASATNSQLTIYKLLYKNSSEVPIAQARIQVTYPIGFVFAAGQPSPDAGNATWNLGTLAPGQEGTITVQGSFRSAQPGQSASLAAALLSIDEQGNPYTQATTQFITTITSLPLVVSQELESTSDTFATARPGDTLRYTLRYQNNATVVARGVNIVASIDSKAVDLTTIRAEGAQINNATITWNASGVQNLESLNPSESGTVSFEVRIKNPAVRDTSKNVTVKTAVKIKSDEYDAYFPGNDLTVTISSIASLEGSIEYASGSLPPKVGTSTTYTVTLTLRNSTNDFDLATLVGFIPLGPGSFDTASVTSREAAGVQFDPSTGKVTWQVGKLAAHTGDFSAPRKLSFTVKLNPTASQAGKTVTLLKNVRFTAHDTFTDEAVDLDIDDLTTGDVGGSNFGNGQVVQ
jgi:uncharacterized repeat protein (TIGR01451 family)